MTLQVLPGAAPEQNPPFSPEAEVSVVGGLLIDPDAYDRCAGVVGTEMFFGTAHRIIFAAIVSLAESDRSVDVITVAQTLKDLGKLEQVGGIDYLSSLLDAVPTAANIAYHAGIVREKAALRRVIDTAKDTLRQAADPGERTASDIADEARTRYADARLGSQLLPLGLPLLDGPDWDAAMDAMPKPSWAIEGLLPHGGTSLLVGVPKAGKSTFARCMAVASARGHEVIGRKTTGESVLLVSLEDPPNTVRQHMRLLGGSPPGLHELDPHHWNDDPWLGSPAHLLKAVEMTGAKLVVIDTVIRWLGLEDTNDYPAVTAAMKEFAKIAKRTDCHIIGVHHGNKAGGAHGRQVMGSGAFFAQVDVGVFLEFESEKMDAPVVIHAKGRGDVEMEPRILDYDKEEGTVALGERPHGDAHAKAAPRERIIRHITSRPGVWIAEKDLKQRTGLTNHNHFKRAMQGLIDDDLVLSNNSSHTSRPSWEYRSPLP